MTCTNNLDKFYDWVAGFSNSLALSPYSGTFKFFAENNFRRDYNRVTSASSHDRSTVGLQAGASSSCSAISICVVLTPILFPLTIATCVLAVLIRTLSVLSQIIAYPVAGLLDSCSTSNRC